LQNDSNIESTRNSQVWPGSSSPQCWYDFLDGSFFSGISFGSNFSQWNFIRDRLWAAQ